MTSLLDTNNPAAASAFGHAAPLFEQDEALNPLARWTRRRSLAALDAAFGPGDRVLELGCGTGLEAVHLARRGVQVVATDAAPGMIAILQAKVTASGSSPLTWKIGAWTPLATSEG